jgi:hypothetical protein
MKAFWLKIAGLVVLTLIAIIVSKVLWPAETASVAESKDVRQIQKEGEGDLMAQTKTRQPEVKQTLEQAKPTQPETIAEGGPNPSAEELYQQALSQKESGDPPSLIYRVIIDTCQQILREYPDSVQAEKAEELLQEVPEQYRKRYNREMSFAYPSEPKVKKSRTLRRRVPRRRQRESYNIPEEKISTSN